MPDDDATTADATADPTGTETALAEVVRLALGTGRRIVDPVAVEAACADRGVGHDQWFAAMAALAEGGLVRMRTAPPSQVVLLSVLDAGLLAYLTGAGVDLADVERRLWHAVVAAPPREAVALHDLVAEPALLVETLLDRWVLERRVVYSKAPGRRFRIHRVLTPPAPGK